MDGLLMLCPSRGRPGNAAALRAEWAGFADAADLLVVVDDDDPDVAAYGGDVLTTHGRHGLGEVINSVAVEMAPRYAAIGFLGDDHRPRTKGWDTLLMAALRGRMGVAYGDDLIRGELVPTAAVISAPVITALGYMVPPGVEHLCHDCFWYQLGKDLGCLEYLPGVKIEHMHPTASKAPWDDGYERANSPGAYARDGKAYADFLEDRWPSDLARLRVTLAS